MIIATAGHVDHGKTSLVKQLTGVDTDSLAEEKRRGLSINLGYAYHHFEDNNCLGFIDVPGHTRFINTMISGVGGIDVGMVIIAADDGIMPQTREHLAVLSLLGVIHYIAVITKIDRVDPTRVLEVQQSLGSLFEAYSSTPAPVFSISNISGAGVDDLLAYLEKRALELSHRSRAGHFRMSIDRAFHLKGAGLVVTGTATSGTVTVGEELRLLPRESLARVRSIHVQDTDSQTGGAGDRCALNVVGDISREDVARGDWLVGRDAAPATKRIDASVRLIANAPSELRHLTFVTVHLGAKRSRARLYLISNTTGGKLTHLRPGETALVQLILDEEIVCSAGDKFLLRDDGEQQTLGGGAVLDPFAPQWGKARQHRLDFLSAMAEPDAASMLHKWLLELQHSVSCKRFCDSWNLTAHELNVVLGRSALSQDVVRLGNGGEERLLGIDSWQSVQNLVLDHLDAWHRENPQEPGVEVSSFTVAQRDVVGEKLFNLALEELQRKTRVELRGGLLSSAGHKAVLVGENQQQWHRVQAELRRQGIKVPLLSELCVALKMQPRELVDLFKKALKAGEVVRLSEKRFSLVEVVLTLSQEVLDAVAENGELSVVEYKTRLGIGRNYAIEILEYLDTAGFTQRRGNARIVLNADALTKRFGKTS